MARAETSFSSPPREWTGHTTHNTPERVGKRWRLLILAAVLSGSVGDLMVSADRSPGQTLLPPRGEPSTRFSRPEPTLNVVLAAAPTETALTSAVTTPDSSDIPTSPASPEAEVTTNSPSTQSEPSSEPSVAAVTETPGLPSPSLTPVSESTPQDIPPAVEASPTPEAGYRETWGNVTLVTDPSLAKEGVRKIKLNTELYPDAPERINAAVNGAFAKALGISSQNLEQRIAAGEHPKLKIFGYGPDNPTVPKDIWVDTSQPVTFVFTNFAGWVKPWYGWEFNYIVDEKGALTIESISRFFNAKGASPSGRVNAVSIPLTLLSSYQALQGGPNNLTPAQVSAIFRTGDHPEAWLLVPGHILPKDPRDALIIAE